jgi:hypothetical protein
MNIQKIQKNFPEATQVPDKLRKLCEFADKDSDYFGCDFRLLEDGKRIILRGMDNDESAASQFAIFARDSSHALYGYWLYDNRSIENAPIVYIDSEGCDNTVLANNVEEFLTLAALGKPILGTIESRKSSDEEDESEYIDDVNKFRAWAKQEFSIDTPTLEEAKQIIKSAKGNHPDFDKWFTDWSAKYYN